MRYINNVVTIDIDDCYKKYAPMIFHRCLGMLGNEDDALDAAQDVFVKLLRYRQRLHGRFLSSLLYTIATNTCLNRLRQRKQQGVPVPETLFPAATDPEFARVEAGMLMDAVLENESESDRAICFMYHRDGMTLQEIGSLIGLSVSGVRKRLLAFGERAKLKAGVPPPHGRREGL
jgi:RNA polymerase sigma-70 factor (ECF subfamily)